MDGTHGTETDSLRVPANKGNEAMTYLTYIIDHYLQPMPSIVAFLHSHERGFYRAWHVDTPLHDNVDSLQNLQLDYISTTGYANLRCNTNPGCKNTFKNNSHVTEAVWWEIFANTTTPFFNPDSAGPAASLVLSSEFSMGSGGGMPIWSPCCAQFAVSNQQIYQRPLDDYVKIRQWLLDTELDNAHSGRVMEFLWHVIFGQQAVRYVQTLH